MTAIVPQLVRGFAEDASRIIFRYKNSDDRSFKCFCSIWLDMKFAQTFTGRRTAAEVLEISEEFLNIAKYFLIHINDAKIKSGGLFLLYSLYYCQPVAAFAKIRLLQNEWLIIKNWWLSLDKDKDDELIYIFLKLYYNNAFKFVFENRVYGLEKSINKYFRELPTSVMMPIHIVMENCAVRTESKAELQQLAQKAKTLRDNYQTFRKALNLETSSTADISSVLTNLSTTANIEMTESNIENTQSDSLGKTRKEIKQKAFATTESSYFRSPEKQAHEPESSDESSYQIEDAEEEEEEEN